MALPASATHEQPSAAHPTDLLFDELSLEIGQEEPGAQLGEEDLDKNLRESDLTI